VDLPAQSFRSDVFGDEDALDHLAEFLNGLVDGVLGVTAGVGVCAVSEIRR
jgi:hypothetical protein